MSYTLNPSDFAPYATVVGAFLEYQNRFLLLQRSPEARAGGEWGIPGGKVDPGETLSEAVSREVFEETSILLPASAYTQCQTLHVRHYGRDIIYHAFTAKLPNMPTVVLRPKEHVSSLFVTPEQALTYPLVSGTDHTIQCQYLGATE